MVMLFEVLGIYFGLALVTMYGIWRLIGRKGFVGLEDTDSNLARLFRKRAAPITASSPAATRAGT